MKCQEDGNHSCLSFSWRKGEDDCWGKGTLLFLCNGCDFKSILEDMDQRHLAYDFCFNGKPGVIPKNNMCGKRGPSLLFTGSQSMQRKVNCQFAKLAMTAGSKQHSPLFLKITNVIWSMAAHRMTRNHHQPFPEPFPILSEISLRQQQWDGQAVEGNCIESCSFQFPQVYIESSIFEKTYVISYILIMLTKATESSRVGGLASNVLARSFQQGTGKASSCPIWLFCMSLVIIITNLVYVVYQICHNFSHPRYFI
jgi:hypothetical protein